MGVAVAVVDSEWTDEDDSTGQLMSGCTNDMLELE